MNEKETIEELTILSYNALGLERSNTRKTMSAQARAAIGVSMGVFFTQSKVAKSLFVDRSNISHYFKNHKRNISYWPGYEEIYNTVNDIVIEQCRADNIQGEIEVLDASILCLIKRKENLQTKLTK